MELASCSSMSMEGVEGEENSGCWLEGEKKNAERKRSVICYTLVFSHISNWRFLSEMGPTFNLCTCPAYWREDSGALRLKSDLSLRAGLPVPVSRVSLHPSEPVFGNIQYIYQNAQNEALSVVLRFILANY